MAGRKKKRSADFIVRPFEGTNKPPGASAEALRRLQEMEETAREHDERSAEQPDDPQPAPERKAKVPAKEAKRAPSTSKKVAKRAAEPEKPRRGGRPAKPGRTQRPLRLTPELDTKLHDLAKDRGIDLNAAVSVAIAEDWRRCFRGSTDT